MYDSSQNITLTSKQSTLPTTSLKNGRDLCYTYSVLKVSCRQMVKYFKNIWELLISASLKPAALTLQIRYSLFEEPCETCTVYQLFFVHNSFLMPNACMQLLSMTGAWIQN